MDLQDSEELIGFFLTKEAAQKGKLEAMEDLNDGYASYTFLILRVPLNVVLYDGMESIEVQKVD